MRKPIAAGRKPSRPADSVNSSAGTIRLKNDADTMIPAANPVSARLRRSFILPPMKNTHAAPSEVPRKGMSTPSVT